jgi:pilus assembly protein Flp/PilA
MGYRKHHAGCVACWTGSDSSQFLSEDRYVFNALSLWLTEREDGQGLAEYALILALIAVVAIAALIFLGGQVNSILSYIGKNI